MKLRTKKHKYYYVLTPKITEIWWKVDVSTIFHLSFLASEGKKNVKCENRAKNKMKTKNKFADSVTLNFMPFFLVEIFQDKFCAIEWRLKLAWIDQKKTHALGSTFYIAIRQNTAGLIAIENQYHEKNQPCGGGWMLPEFER